MLVNVDCAWCGNPLGYTDLAEDDVPVYCGQNCAKQARAAEEPE